MFNTWCIVTKGSTRVLKTTERGHALQFAWRLPNFRGIIDSAMGLSDQKARVLSQEVASLLNMWAIRVIPKREAICGHYSCYFLVHKKGGGLSPLMDQI